jgi:hypothetical protein
MIILYKYLDDLTENQRRSLLIKRQMNVDLTKPLPSVPSLGRFIEELEKPDVQDLLLTPPRSTPKEKKKNVKPSEPKSK